MTLTMIGLLDEWECDLRGNARSPRAARVVPRVWELMPRRTASHSRRRVS